MMILFHYHKCKMRGIFRDRRFTKKTSPQQILSIQQTLKQEENKRCLGQFISILQTGVENSIAYLKKTPIQHRWLLIQQLIKNRIIEIRQAAIENLTNNKQISEVNICKINKSEVDLSQYNKTDDNSLEIPKQEAIGQILELIIENVEKYGIKEEKQWQQGKPQQLQSGLQSHLQFQPQLQAQPSLSLQQLPPSNQGLPIPIFQKLTEFNTRILKLVTQFTQNIHHHYTQKIKQMQHQSTKKQQEYIQLLSAQNKKKQNQRLKDLLKDSLVIFEAKIDKGVVEDRGEGRIQGEIQDEIERFYLRNRQYFISKDNDKKETTVHYDYNQILMNPFIYFSQSQVFDELFDTSQCPQPNLIDLITQQIQNSLIRQIKGFSLLFRFNHKIPQINPHKYIDNSPRLLLIAKLKQNSQIIGGFSDNGINRDLISKGFIFSGSLKSCSREQIGIYKMTQKFRNKSISGYDNFYINFGNGDIKIKIGTDVVESAFGLESSFFKANQKLKVGDFLNCQNSRTATIANYQFYQVTLNS